MTNAISYQGRLTDNGSPASGSYDFVFALFDAPTGGTQIRDLVTNLAVNVSGGLFNATMDFDFGMPFGNGAFDGNDRWLDLAVRTNGAGTFNPLTPATGGQSRALRLARQCGRLR